MDHWDRFWTKVRFAWPDECWEWRGSVTREKDGKVHCPVFFYQGKSRISQRVGWEMIYGPIPDGLLVCHTCDNRICCNPLHWFLGTHLDNMQDKVRKGRHVTPSGDNHWTRLYPHLVRRGERSPQAKLEQETILRIRRLWRTGEFTTTQIGRQVGMNRATVRDIVTRRTWAWLPEEE